MQHTLKLAAPSAAIALAGLVAFSIPASGRANPRDDVPAGGLDQRFGYAGIASTPLSSVTADRFLAVTVGEDGQTYAAGFVTLGTDQAIATDQVMAVARIAPDGSLDQSFDGDGIGIVNVAVDGKTAEIARGLVVQSTGKVVVGGQMEHDPTATGDAAMDTDIALSRFGPDGTLDPTFGEGGTARFDLSSGVVLPPTPPSTTSGFRGDTMWGVTTLADDRIVVVAAKRAPGADRTDNDFALMLLTEDGDLDTDFGTGGIVTIDIDGGNESPRQAVVQPDGMIVMAGYSSKSGVVIPQLVRVDDSGELDPGFGAGGIASAQLLPAVAEAYDVAMQGDNFIITGYGRASATEEVDLIAARFKANGAWDRSFGNDGLVRIDIAGEADRGRDLVVFSDGRVLIAGSGKPSAADINGMIVMLNRNGSLDRSFGRDGILMVDLGGPADSFFGSALTADGKKAMVAGYRGSDLASVAPGDDARVVRVRKGRRTRSSSR
jgi:uncharacterized delta-60 repeat protein